MNGSVILSDSLKTCCKCKNRKESSEFSKDSTRCDGLRNLCKVCDYQRVVKKRSERKTKKRCADCHRDREIGCYCSKHYFENRCQKSLGKRDINLALVIKDKIKQQNYKCVYTGEKLILGVNAHLDHIMPRSRFPELANDVNNLEWVTDEINNLKGQLTKEEFLRAFPQYNKTSNKMLEVERIRKEIESLYVKAQELLKSA